MTSFEDRKKGYEAKYLKDQEAQFKIRAKRNKFLGLWAAEIIKPEKTEIKNTAIEIWLGVNG